MVKFQLGSPGNSVVKNLPAKQEMLVPSLSHEEPLEKEMAAIPVVLTGKSHGQRSLAVYSLWGCKVNKQHKILID